MNRKAIISITLALIVFLGGAIYLFNFSDLSKANLEPVIVTMNDSGYDVSRLEVQTGQTVKFVNNSSEDRWPASNIHPTHQIYPEFDPQEPVKPGESWSFKFNKAGSWRFHDHIKPEITGVIEVK